MVSHLFRRSKTTFLKGVRMSVRHIARYAAAIVLVMAGVASAASAQTYVQTNLVSDIPGLAPTTDPLLVNPWGIARSGSSPWWVADNGTGVSTIYNGAGVPAQNPPGTQFVVQIPTPSGTGTSAPTGMVSVLQPPSPAPPIFAGARFIFATEDGTIAAWIPAISQFTAVIKVDHSSTAIYKGLAISSFNGATTSMPPTSTQVLSKSSTKAFSRTFSLPQLSPIPVFRTALLHLMFRRSEVRLSSLLRSKIRTNRMKLTATASALSMSSARMAF
jgi:hypothetical protein